MPELCGATIGCTGQADELHVPGNICIKKQAIMRKTEFA